MPAPAIRRRGAGEARAVLAWIGDGKLDEVAVGEAVVQPDRVLFGTDFPPGGAAADYVTSIRELKMFSEAALRAVERDNAVRLIPRLAKS